MKDNLFTNVGTRVDIFYTFFFVISIRLLEAPMQLIASHDLLQSIDQFGD